MLSYLEVAKLEPYGLIHDTKKFKCNWKTVMLTGNGKKIWLLE